MIALLLTILPALPTRSSEAITTASAASSQAPATTPVPAPTEPVSTVAPVDKTSVAPLATSGPLQGVQLAKLVADQRSADSLFGSALALSGDTLVVGAWLHASGKGTVYIFQRDPANPNRWLQTGQLLASDGAAGDHFGVSVAIYGSTIVVGAEYAKAPHNYSGAVYIFDRDPGSTNQWRQTAKLIASDTREQLMFGHDVAIDGDTLVVAAWWDYTGTSSTYVFERNRNGDPGWRETARPSTVAGKSVAIQGDTLVVGDPQDWGERGTVFIFGRNQGGAGKWGQVAELLASDAHWADEFGSDVALDGDILAIAARRKGSLGSVDGRGGAYIFTRNAGGDPVWRQAAMLQSSDGGLEDSFGSSIAIKNRTLLVGAMQAENTSGTPGKGAAYVFTPQTDNLSSWQEIARLTANDAAPGDTLGSAVATDGQTLISGAAGDDSYRGAVYTHRIYPRPQTRDDVVTTAEDRAIAIDVLANDSADPATGILRRDSVAVVTAPISGTAQVDTVSGAITYTPKLNFFGSDSFTYSVDSTIGTRATANVKITVEPVNDPPIFLSTPPLSVVDRAGYNYTIKAQDIDSGERLTFTAPISRPWLTLRQVDGQTAWLSGTAPYTEIGQHTIQVKVQDAGGLSATQTFTLTVKPNVLGPPSNLKVIPRSATELGLEWRDGVNGEVGFKIERRSGAGSWQQIATVGANATAYTDTALVCDNFYEYRVRAYNEYSDGEYSNVASSTPNVLVTRTFSYTGAPVTIFDYRTAEASIVIDDVEMIADLDVEVEIEHIYVGDLRLSLIAPDGSELTLVNGKGEFQHHYTGTVFDDEAGSAIDGAAAPFSGSFRPQHPLSALDLGSSSGTWKLVVNNHDGPFRGTIKQFSLRFAIPGGCAAGAAAQSDTGDPPASAVNPAGIEASTSAAASFSEISAGEAHVCALQPDGVLGCWGWNDAGQTNVPSGTYRSVGTGFQYTCAVRDDYTLGCWGSSSSGKTSPPSGTFTKVSAGDSHACAIRTDQTVACWGNNGGGSATPPTGLFKEISAGSVHSCGIRIDDTLGCGGVNYEGQLMAPSGTFTRVSAGARHTCAVRSDSVLLCWGDNWKGQNNVPPGTYKDVASGLWHTCAIRTDDTVVCWGLNDEGQAAPPAGTFTRISAEYKTTCALSTDTTAPLRCWGEQIVAVAPTSLPAGTVNASYSQQFSASRGAAPYSFTISRGVLPPGLTLSQNGLLSGVPTRGGSYSLLVKAQDQNGLGNEYPYTLTIGTDPAAPQPSPPPAPIDPPLSVAPETISAGGSFSCGVRDNYTLACWGRNDYNKATPPAGTFVQVSAGEDHGCALETSRRVRCWGNSRGYNGSYANQNLSPYGTFKQVSAGTYHNCAVQNDAAVHCWGDNTWGQSNAPQGK
ncbi:MAG TPA: putative Ig domain-containing protein, partial [Herpetosiphonaceae bacterium]